MKIDESKYPMTYKEYEKRVIELFYAADVLEEMIKRVDEELRNTPNYIQGFYGHDCWVYDNPELYGELCKKTFEDSQLRQTPVSNLRKLIG